MKHGSLFSGIGGFDLASQWMGWENVFHCEIESFPRKILHHYWPNAISYEDIKKTDFTIHKGGIDIITGGFPCQPYSMAGKRKGKEDERHLWPEMLRAIREIQPRWVVGENVFGLINWNGGLVFDEVQSDLEAEGYEVQAYVLPAASVNAPHRRDRVWFVAYNNSFIWRTRGEYERAKQPRYRKSNEGSNTKIDGNATDTNGNGCDDESSTKNNILGSDNKQSGTQWIGSVKGFSDESDVADSDSNGLNKCDCEYEIDASKGGKYAQCNIKSRNGNGDVADTNGNGIKKSGNKRQSKQLDKNGSKERTFAYSSCFRQEYALENRKLERGRFRLSNQRYSWDSFPTQSPICSRNDGLSIKLDNITFPKWRNESIKGYGNAIVPQVVYQIFKAIEEYESL